MSSVDTVVKKQKGMTLDKTPNEAHGLFDPAFFADESRSKPVIGQRFANVLRLPRWTLPSADVREWVRNLEALSPPAVNGYAGGLGVFW
jgi:hypothetical protein